MKDLHVCPAKHAGMLNNGLRRLIQNPVRIVSPYLSFGMTAADIGCGPGFFLKALADAVGSTGIVYGYDVQSEMLAKAAEKLKGEEAEERVRLQQCRQERIGFVEKVDFVLGFYMVHETPDESCLLEEVFEALNPGGIFVVVEPFIHVPKKRFDHLVSLAAETGFVVASGPGVFFSRSAVFKK